MPPEKASSNRNTITIPIAIVIAGAMIAAAVYWSGSRDLGYNTGTNANIEIDVEPVTSADRILGNASAEVMIIEYSDLECPFCKVFHNTMHRIVDEYDGRVAWVYRHYPIFQLHSRAPKEAEASECAYEQGDNSMFWKFIDEVFATTESNNALDPAELPRIAGKLGLNVPSFNQCLSSGKYTQKIEEDVEKAVEAGARGTPYSVIIKGDEQVVINGAEPYESVKIKIDSILD
jgi:protein-disulfide isomerase